MTRQSEYKKKFNPETGKFTREHIYGGGFLTDSLKSIGKKVFGKTVKSAATKGIEKAMTAAATKTGEYVGKKAGDKIVSILSKEKPKSTPKVRKVNTRPNKQHKINAKVNSILSGGKII